MRSFTLIEVLVVTLVITIILAGLYVALSVGQGSFFTGDVGTQLRAQLTRAIMTMDGEIGQARPTMVNLPGGLDIGASSNSITFSVPSDTDIPPDGSVVDDFGSIEWSGNITYSRNAANQLIRTFAGTNTTLANDITSLQFQRTQERIIQVDITAQKTTPLGRQVNDTEQAVIQMRN